MRQDEFGLWQKPDLLANIHSPCVGKYGKEFRGLTCSEPSVSEHKNRAARVAG